MPQLPMYSNKNFNDSTSDRKRNKKRRKKPRTLTSSQISTPYDSSTSLSPTPSSPSYAAKSSISRAQPQSIPHPMIYQPPTTMSNNVIHQNIDNNQINHKLDLLINIIHSQQKLLENLVINTNKSEEDKDEKKKGKRLLLLDKGIQTMDIPRYIIQSEQDSKQQSPFTKYPPIPQPHNKDNNNIPVPYQTLLKLVSAVTVGHKLPQHSSYPPQIPMRYDNNNNHHHHHYNSGHDMNNNPNIAMSPKSTLHFSDC